jgi:hypothetical protein
MNFPFDRMSVVTFSDVGALELSLAGGDSPAPVQAVIDALEVATNPFITLRPPCDPSGGDPRGCGNTNPADGLMVGGNLFGDPNADGVQSPGEIRQEAVWIMILLGDGAANAVYDDSSFPITDRAAWICPNPGLNPGQPNWIRPLCTDIDPSNGAGRRLRQHLVRRMTPPATWPTSWAARMRILFSRRLALRRARRRSSSPLVWGPR